MPSSKQQKYKAKQDALRLKIRSVIETGKAKLSGRILSLVDFSMSESPNESILKMIEDPDMKLMHLEEILRAICSHKAEVVEFDEMGVCTACSSLVGWWCPDSPDHHCHYSSIEKEGKRVVELRGGKFVNLPKSHKHQYENSDSCIFCQQPSERK